MRLLLFRTLTVAILFLTPAAIHAGEQQGVVHSTLKNGLRVVIVMNNLAPVVTTEINYLAGGNESPDGFPGTAHALEHMMFRGSPGLTSAQLSTIIASLGGDFNAQTQQTATQYFFTVPAADIDIALNIEAVRMRGLLATDPLWEQERGAIDQEVAQDLSDPNYILSTRLIQALYADTPYAVDPLGTRESFAKTTGAMLKKFHDTWYVPNNAVLVIVGDVDPPRVLARVRQLFEDIPARPLPQRPRVQLGAVKPVLIELETDMPYSMALAAYRLPGSRHPDFAAGQILAEALSSRLGKLYDLVLSGKALETAFESNPLPEAATGYAVAAFPEGGDGKAMIQALRFTVTGYAKTGIPPELVEAAKRHEIADAEFRKNSVPGLAELWSQAVAVDGKASPDEYIDEVRKVTPADVDRIARQYLVNDGSVTAVLTPRPSNAPVQHKDAKGPESFTPSQVEPVEVPVWARSITATPALPAMHAPPVDRTLPNGLRVIVQPETVSDTVQVYGMVRNDPFLQEPQGKEGVSRLMDGLFSYGTTSLDRVSFQKALDEIAADIMVGTKFGMKVPADRFERGMQLLADNLLHPAFPADAFAVVRGQAAGTVTGEQTSPAYRSHRQMKIALYGKDDPSVREPSPKTLSGLTLDDVRSYHRDTFRPDLTTIVVIGNVSSERALTAALSWFGQWKATGPRPKTDPDPAPLNKPAAIRIPDESRVQDDVRLAQVLGLTRKDPDYYALQFGNHVLSGAFYATRLYRDLREKTGLVYAVESAMEIGKTRSRFMVAYASDPQNVGQARARIDGNLRSMQTTTITQQELRMARALLVRKVPLSRASTENIALDLLDLARDDLPLDEPRTAAMRYLQMKPEDVQAAFRKWIRPGDFVQVTVGPAE